MNEEKKHSNLRVIIDTNIFISFFINDNLSFIDEIIRNEKIDFVVSKELLDEISRVLSRPKFVKYVNKEKTNLLINLLSKFGILTKVTSDINLCRDENDNFLLSLAKDSKADFLITGDKDLLELYKFEKTFIVKMSDFKQLIKNL